jgi:hypothetical protein
MAKQKKNIKIDAEVDGNKLHISKDENGVDVIYDGKNRDVEIHKDDEEKRFKYDGKKLDVEIKKINNETTVEVKAESGILKTVGKILTKLVLKRFKK